MFCKGFILFQLHVGMPVLAINCKHNKQMRWLCNGIPARTVFLQPQDCGYRITSCRLAVLARLRFGTIGSRSRTVPNAPWL